MKQTAEAKQDIYTRIAAQIVEGRRLGSNAYAQEELVAEFGAVFLCADLGTLCRGRTTRPTSPTGSKSCRTTAARSSPPPHRRPLIHRATPRCEPQARGPLASRTRLGQRIHILTPREKRECAPCRNHGDTD